MLRLLSCLLLTTLMLGLPTLARAQSDGGYDLSPRIQNRIVAVEKNFEHGIRQYAPKFRLVRVVEDFPPIEGRAVDVPVRFTDRDMARLKRVGSPQVVATLHDRRTAAPLDACLAPCTLTSPLVPPGLVILYRYGSKPQDEAAESLAFYDDDTTIMLGFNEVEHQIERDRCALEFKRIRQLETDRDAAPCVRVPPLMPRMAIQSGHCDLAFNITSQGETIDVVATECTDPIFCEPTVEAVQRWIYYPKLELGERVERPGVESKMTFTLSNESGQIIPEPDGEMQPCIGSV